MKKIESLICCGQELILDMQEVESNQEKEEVISVSYYYCNKCGKFIKVYQNQEKAKEMEKALQEKSLVNHWRTELVKRGYYVIKDAEYSHHGEVILRELQEDLSSLEMKILGEVKGDQTIIYLQPESCCSLADEYDRKPIKLPLIQLPANTKGVKYFDYFPSSWKNPTFGFKKGEIWEGTLKSIWKNRDKSSHVGTYFPKVKNELMEKLINKGFRWEGGEENDNYLKAICPRYEWTYNCELTEKYMKVEEQKEMAKAVKNHEC